MSQAFRDSPEWNELLRALNAVVGADPDSPDRMLVADFTIVVFQVPATEESEFVGGYTSYGSTPHPHINEGLLDQGLKYWGDIGVNPDDGG